MMLLLQTPTVDVTQRAVTFYRDPAEAMKVATKLKKPIILVISASWCVPCRALKAELGREPYRGILNRNYVVAFSETDDKNPAIAKRTNAFLARAPTPNAGFPYPTAIDAKGRFLADSGNVESGEGMMRVFHATISKERRMAELMPLRKYLDARR